MTVFIISTCIPKTSGMDSKAKKCVEVHGKFVEGLLLIFLYMYDLLIKRHEYYWYMYYIVYNNQQRFLTFLAIIYTGLTYVSVFLFSFSTTWQRL